MSPVIPVPSVLHVPSGSSLVLPGVVVDSCEETVGCLVIVVPLYLVLSPGYVVTAFSVVVGVVVLLPLNYRQNQIH